MASQATWSEECFNPIEVLAKQLLRKLAGVDTTCEGQCKSVTVAKVITIYEDQYLAYYREKIPYITHSSAGAISPPSKGRVLLDGRVS